jgi:hypothetical protein
VFNQSYRIKKVVGVFVRFFRAPLLEQAQKTTERYKSSENISFVKEESIATLADLNLIFNKWEVKLRF